MAPGGTRIAEMAERVFGYGSLVNRATHDMAAVEPARLAGWRRIWMHLPGRAVAILSVLPAADTIDGLLCSVPGGDWTSLDRREALYRRHPVMARGGGTGPIAAQIYAVPDPGRQAGPHPILLSYLDVVVQGLLREFGQDGVARFFATTEGWAAGVLDDRAAPRYPRARALTHAERALVDTGLAAVGAAPAGGPRAGGS